MEFERGFREERPRFVGLRVRLASTQIERLASPPSTANVALGRRVTLRRGGADALGVRQESQLWWTW